MMYGEDCSRNGGSTAGIQSYVITCEHEMCHYFGSCLTLEFAYFTLKMMEQDMFIWYCYPITWMLHIMTNTMVNKLVADHSVERMVLMGNHCHMSDDGTQLHRAFYYPIIIEDPLICHHPLTGLFSEILSSSKER